MNVVALVGRVVADPELKQTQTGIAVTQIRIAVQRAYKSNGQTAADFIDVVAWRQTAEFICKYFRKGQMIAVNGSIQTRNYTDSNGNKRYVVEVLADNVSFTGSKSESTSNYRPEQFNNVESNNYTSGDFENVEIEDDLPF